MYIQLTYIDKLVDISLCLIINSKPEIIQHRSLTQTNIKHIYNASRRKEA